MLEVVEVVEVLEVLVVVEVLEVFEVLHGSSLLFVCMFCGAVGGGGQLCDLGERRPGTAAEQGVHCTALHSSVVQCS